MRQSTARTLAVALAVAVAGSACASGPRQKRQAAERERLLTAAGFRQIPADTPERADALERLQPGAVVPVLHRERTFYVYPDKQTCKCLYVGRADEYDSYLNLVKQQKNPPDGPLPWNADLYSNGSALLNPAAWGTWDWWN